MVRRTAAAALSLLMSSQPVWGAGAACPAAAPADGKERRTVAKEWFGRAERAEGEGDLVTATKAYQCSMRMVPHAFTAYNLGRVSEKAGDLELAHQAYETYLGLAPEANDRSEVAGKVTALEARIEAIKAQEASKPPAPIEQAPEVAPVVVPTAASDHAADKPRFGALGWTVTGVGVAALAGGLVLNTSARSQMQRCRSLSNEGKPEAEWGPVCDGAKPRAYASYALFGLVGAAAVVDALLLMRGPQSDETRVSFAPLPGGGALVTSGRF